MSRITSPSTVIVILGLPFADLERQVSLLSVSLGVPGLYAPDILLEAWKQRTQAGVAAKQALDRGGIVPEDTMTRVICDRLSAADARDGFILGRFPWSAASAAALDRFLASLGMRVDLAVLLDPPLEDLVDRALPAGEATPSELAREAVRQKLTALRLQVESACACYQSNTGFVRFGATADPDRLAADISQAVRVHLQSQADAP